jgi:hypothetical protein
MQASNSQLASQPKSGESGIIRLITSSKLWPLHQDNRSKAPELQPFYCGSESADRKEPNLDLAGAAHTFVRSEEPPPGSNHDRRLRFIEEHHKNGILEQKLETLKALLSDMTRQRDSWQSQAERSLASFQETQQEMLRFVRQIPDPQRKKRRFLSLFRTSA